MTSIERLGNTAVQPPVEDVGGVDIDQTIDVPPTQEFADEVIGGEQVAEQASAPVVAAEMPTNKVAEEAQPAGEDVFKASEVAIRDSEAFKGLALTLADTGAAVEEKIKAIATFLDEAREIAFDAGVVTPGDFRKIPVIEYLLEEDVKLALDYQHQESLRQDAERANGSSQLLSAALEEVKGDKSPEEKLAILESAEREAVKNYPRGFRSLPETALVKNAIAELKRGAAAREKRGMPTRPERKGFFASIGALGAIPSKVRNFFRERRERAAELQKEQDVAILFDRAVADYNALGGSIDDLREGIAILETFLERAAAVYGSQEAASKQERVKAVIEQLAAEKAALVAAEQGGVDEESQVEEPSAEIVSEEDQEVVGGDEPAEVSEPSPAAPAPEAAPEVREEGGDEADDEPEVPELNIPQQVAPEPEPQAPAVEVPSLTQEAEPSVVSVEPERRANEASLRAAFEKNEREREAFTASLRKAFKQLQESRIIDGKVQKITSGEAYRRFNEFLADATRGQQIDRDTRVSVLREIFETEKRSAPRVILAMALRDLGVEVKMKPGELGQFERGKV